MQNKEVDTTAPEVKEESEETVIDTDQDTEDSTTGEEAEAEPTVGDLDETTKDKPKPEMIPKARLDKEIRRKKELEKELSDLKAGEEDEDSTSDSESNKSDLEDRLSKIENDKKDAERNRVIESHIAKALENNPEFKDVANTDVIKQMALNPLNKDKTYPQLFEEAYGNSVSGKRTTEDVTNRGGAKDEKVDVQRAQKDGEYLKKVLADPVLKKQYNEGLEHRINL